MIAAAQALYAMGEKELGDRLMAMEEEMDFSKLFDFERKQFYIGWDGEKDSPSKAWYDLMASEARQTSFLAVAKGDVPKSHWKKLGRTPVTFNNYSGMVSWTGTMFEYLMPNLLLPCRENSLP